MLVFQNLKILIFVIKFPLPLKKCKKVSILPVAHNGKIPSFRQHNQLAKCDEGITSVSKCRKTLSSTFCSATNDTKCALQLFNGKKAKCSTEFNSLEEVTLIDVGEHHRR